jgi:hypothetical protein
MNFKKITLSHRVHFCDKFWFNEKQTVLNLKMMNDKKNFQGWNPGWFGVWNYSLRGIYWIQVSLLYAVCLVMLRLVNILYRLEKEISGSLYILQAAKKGHIRSHTEIKSTKQQANVIGNFFLIRGFFRFFQYFIQHWFIEDERFRFVVRRNC